MKTNSWPIPSARPVPHRARGARFADARRAVLFTILLLLPLCAHADKKKKGSQHAKAAPRIIAQGKVINHAKAPIGNAVVYLEDPKSLAIRSYLTDNNGSFHFAQLSPQTDYEIWAEQNGVESKHKFISQFSNHTTFTFTLQLDGTQKHKLLGFL